MKKHLKMFIEGIVQGVGFRPHVYNIAKSFGLHGYVLNDGKGVTIEAEASGEILQKFRDYLLDHPPKISKIQRVFEEITDNIEGYDGFEIRKSTETGMRSVLISPDIATCGDCLREMNDPKERRYRYPFINCTNCGPRFTIVTDVPYDRHNTSMAGFPMCDYCTEQYEEPSDRRFHAQPIACPVCGPRVFLYDSKKNEVCKEPDKILEKAVELLKSGMIIAIKGMGGYHLAVDADNEEAVRTLRKRKYREDKPFAVMAPDIETIKKYCLLSKDEEELLKSHRSPIVLLGKIPGSPLAPSVAPGNNNLGVMLPYSPLHHLIANDFKELLVMTSGNVSDEPIVYKNEDAFKRLGGIADYFLVHDRPIHTRCDDSVTRIFRGEEYILRRSRGYAPFPVEIGHETELPLLAVGGELKNTFCLLRKNQAFVSHHIGDLENIETLESFEEGIRHYEWLFNIKPEAVAYDMHPRYLSTQYAISLPIEKIAVQHHHAHAASVMAERHIEGEVIGAILDGVGYGDDGNLWGFEFLRAGFADFERLLHLKYVSLPGGEKAIKEPWRMAVSYLHEVYGAEMHNLPLSLFKSIDGKQIDFTVEMIKKRIGSPLIGSAGRLFDAVSAIIGTRNSVNFEGQAAIEMEMAADKDAQGGYDFEIRTELGAAVIDPSGIIKGAVNDVINGKSRGEIAGKFHNTIASVILEGVKFAANITGLDRVVLCGGVFQNMLLLEKTMFLLENEGFNVYIHRLVPSNDGGISLGQAAIAGERLRLKHFLRGKTFAGF